MTNPATFRGENISAPKIIPVRFGQLRNLIEKLIQFTLTSFFSLLFLILRVDNDFRSSIFKIILSFYLFFEIARNKKHSWTKPRFSDYQHRFVCKT